MNRLHILLAIVAVLAFVVYPVSLVVTDTTPAQFGESAEDIESYPGPDTPWYAVGFMPVLLIGGSLSVLLAVLVWAMNITGMRRFAGGKE